MLHLQLRIEIVNIYLMGLFIIFMEKAHMDKFILTTKNGEKIAMTKADNIFEAREFFAKKKQLPVLTLLQIFKVESVG
jgi:hypothetical protein